MCPWPTRRADEIEVAVDLRGDREDADLSARRGDHRQDVRAGKVRGSGVGPAGTSEVGRRRHASGCAPRKSGAMKLLSRCAGSTCALPAPGSRARRADAVEQMAQLGWPARDGRRAEPGHPVPRQPARDLGHGIGRGEGVLPFHAVHVHVDETRHDHLAAHVDHASLRRAMARRGPRRCARSRGRGCQAPTRDRPGRRRRQTESWSCVNPTRIGHELAPRSGSGKRLGGGAALKTRSSICCSVRVSNCSVGA